MAKVLQLKLKRFSHNSKNKIMSIEKKILELVGKANEGLSYQNVIGLLSEFELMNDDVKLRYLNVIKVMTGDKFTKEIESLENEIKNKKEDGSELEKPKTRARKSKTVTK